MRHWLLLLIAACGFPAPAYKPMADGGLDSSTGLDAGAEAAMMEHVDPPLPDASDDRPPLKDSGNPCDKDNDMSNDVNCSMGKDCDDTDDRAHPGVVGWQYFLATQVTKGDWNCDHTVDTEVPVVNLKCSNYSSGCTSLAGFETNPPCGTFANYITCKAGGLLQPCATDTMKMRQQGCL